MGLNDGLYGMWSPYYYPTQDPVYNVYNPANSYYPYYNPWTPEYVSSIDAYRSRVSAESVLDYYRGVADGAASVNPIVVKI